MSLKRPYKARSSEEGFILVTVLIVIALLFPLVLAFNSRVQLNLTQAENFRNSVQAIRMARSGVEGAIAILKNSDPTYDSPKSLWAMGFPGLSLAQGILTVNITDEDSKIPVNNLVWAPGQTSTTAAGTSSGTSTGTSASAGTSTGASSSSGTSQGQTTFITTATTAATGMGTSGITLTEAINKDLNTQLRALVTTLGGNPQIIDALIDWLSTGNIVTEPGGAKEAYYQPLGYNCKDGPLDSLDELLLIKGFDKELVDDKGLNTYLTVAPTDGKINVNTASLGVLQVVLGTQTSSLAQPLAQGDIEDLVNYRNQHELHSVNDIMAVKISQGDLSKITPLIKVNSSYFTVTSKYTIGKVVKNVEALLRRSGSAITVVSWRES